MKLVSLLQKEYQTLWKHIIRPPRNAYSEKDLGPALFQHQGITVQRKDFRLTNRRGYQFTCSLWLPTKAERSHCLIYLHCNSSNRLEGMEYLDQLIAEGIALCTFDFSGCGNAQGEYISLGFYEQEDLQQVIDFLKIYPRIGGISLWGRSMGAVTALLYLEKDKNICAAVFDSPFKSFKSLVEDMANKKTKVPGLVLSAALKIMDGTVRQKANFSLYDIDPFKKAVSFVNIPAFFIVGIEDEIVPIQHTSDLFEAYAGDDKIIKMVNGGHNDMRPEVIVKLVVQFLKSRFEDNNSYIKEEVKKQIAPKKEIQVHLSKKEQPKQEVLLEETEVKKVEQAVKKGEFSWSSIFSGFSKGKKQSKEDKKQERADRKQQTEVKQEIKENVEEKKKKTQKQKQSKESKEEKELKKQKRKKEKQLIKKSEFEATLEEKVRQYSFCYL